tara:strand:- start:446 stop:550 length:105 start_codon:yes stop_codon:yes gene_type:complete
MDCSKFPVNPISGVLGTVVFGIDLGGRLDNAAIS